MKQWALLWHFHTRVLYAFLTFTTHTHYDIFMHVYHVYVLCVSITFCLTMCLFLGLHFCLRILAVVNNAT